MENFSMCPSCGRQIPAEFTAVGTRHTCPFCKSVLPAAKTAERKPEKHEAECFHCGQLFYIDRLMDYNGRNICSRCLHIIEREEVEAKVRRKNITVQLVLIVIILVGAFCFWRFYLHYPYPYKITDIEATTDSERNLGSIKASFDTVSSSGYDDYAVVYFVDSKEDMKRAVESLFEECEGAKTKTTHLARWWPRDGNRQFFAGEYGKGGIQWIDDARHVRRCNYTTCRYVDGSGKVCARIQWLNPEVRQCGRCIEDVGIHAVVFLDRKPSGGVVLPLEERDFGRFQIADDFVLKAQLWCRGSKKWKPASEIFEKTYSW
jgi:hypothetical protein